jgi:hypothetical protein
MGFSSVLSFLGGSAFRMLWGEISSAWNKHQDHKHEIERMRLQAEIEAGQHARNLESQKLQAEMGIKVIEAQAVADVGRIEAEGWLDAVRSTGKAIGVAWVDAWNAAIRPGGATWAIAMLTLDSFAVASVKENTAEVCFAFLGLFVADRTLGKKGK